MNTRKRLQTILKTLDLTQTELAGRLGVSFVAFNNWWTGKAEPRPKMQARIDDLYKEVTGQKTVSDENLAAKKKTLADKSAEHKNVIREILDSQDIYDEFVLQLTYNSNSIEGSTLNRPDTAAILFDDSTVPNHSLIEHLEARNHHAALDYLLQHLNRCGVIDKRLILDLHAKLMNGILRDAGRYRDHAVRLLGVPLPTANPVSVPQKIAEVMAYAVEPTDDIIAKAVAVHASFEQIHPFADGNGRVGRLLLAAMLLRANLPPAIIEQERKQLYYAYLYKAQTSDDQSQLQSFLCDAVMSGFGILERHQTTE
ncbi:MAG: Fic family protein [Patescibacteria group bacterium]